MVPPQWSAALPPAYARIFAGVKSSLSEDSSNYGTFASLNPDFSLGEANDEIARTGSLGEFDDDGDITNYFVMSLLFFVKPTWPTWTSII